VIVGGALAIVAFTLICVALIRPLEVRFPVASASDFGDPNGIMALGGGATLSNGGIGGENGGNSQNISRTRVAVGAIVREDIAGQRAGGQQIQAARAKAWPYETVSG
jgi:hypothetical protein